MTTKITIDQMITEIANWKGTSHNVHEIPHFIFDAWREAAKEHLASYGMQPIKTAPEKTVIVVAWVDEDGCTRYEFEWLEDGVWHEHSERYEHYLACAPRDVPCVGPSEKAPYTHWMDLPVLSAALMPPRDKPTAYCPKCKTQRPHHGDPDSIHLHLCDVCNGVVEY